MMSKSATSKTKTLKFAVVKSKIFINFLISLLRRSKDWKVPLELVMGENDYYDDTHKKNVISLESFDKKDVLSSGKRSALRAQAAKIF